MQTYSTMVSIRSGTNPEICSHIFNASVTESEMRKSGELVNYPAAINLTEPG